MPDTTDTSATTEPVTKNPLLADAVLEGGGVRGIGHVGALVEAEKRGYQWVNVAGTWGDMREQGFTPRHVLAHLD